jgi:hypothetical protein
MAARRWPVRCALATSRYPHTVLRNREAARFSGARELQARGRGSPRHPWATIAACLGAGAGVHATAEGSGGMAYGLLGVH